jgi:hypothetical protein
MSGIRTKLFGLLAWLVIIASHALLALAQTETTGAIQGGVYHMEAGATQPIVRAAVSVRNQDTGLERLTRTDNLGIYRFDMLPPGVYLISATADGFESTPGSTLNNFQVYLSKTNLVQPPPIVLRRSGAPAPAPAAAAGPPPAIDNPEQLVNSLNATRGGNFDGRPLTTLPLPGTRSFETLAFLLPGVAPPPEPIGSTVGPGLGAGIGTAGQFAVNGQRARANNFTVDGSDNNDEDVGVRRQGFVALVPQSLESVQEFQMFTHLWEAGVGRNLGSQVNAVSKSGTNQIHGTLYGFFNESALNARNFFDYTSDRALSYTLTARALARFTGNPQDVTVPVTVIDGGTRIASPLVQPNPSDVKDQFRRAQGGAALGFPLIRDRTFFFGSFERQDIKAQKETHFAVPTIAQRGFLGSGTTGFTIPGLNLGTVHPTFRPTFTGGDAIFSLFPFPNNPIGPYGESTFTQVLPADAEGTVFSLKLDHNFKLFGPQVAHTVTGRYNFTNDERQVPAVGGAIFSRLKAHVRTQNLSLFLSSQLAARISNQVRGSYGRTGLRFESLPDPFLSPSYLAASDRLNGRLLLNTTSRFLNVSCAGLPTTQVKFGCFPPQALSQNLVASYFRQTPVGTISTSAGNIPITGVENNLGPIGQVIVAPFSPLGLDSYLFPQGRVNNTFQIADTFTLFQGGHNLRLGADIRRTQLNSFLHRNFRPQVVFGGTADLTLTTPVNGLPSVLRGLSRLGDTPGFFSGSDLAALGLPTGIFQALSIGSPNTEIGLRLWQHNFFFTDTWRLRRGLTLNYGLRYEYNTVPREVNRRIENTFSLNNVPPVDPAISFGASTPQFLAAFNETLTALNQFLDGRETIYDPDRNNFGPHVGFAWDPFAGSRTQAGKTIIRGGAGLYYDIALGNVISQSRNVFPTFLPVNTDVNLFARNFGSLYLRPPDGFTRIFNLFFLGIALGGNTENFRGASCSQLQPGVFGCDLVSPNTLNVIGLPPGALQAYLGRTFNPAAAGRPFSGSGLAFTLPDRRLRSPQAYHFNLQIERELFRDFLVNAAYVGARGLELVRFRTPNGGLNSPTIPIEPLGLTLGTGGANLIPACALPPLSGASLPAVCPTLLTSTPPLSQSPVRPIPALGAYTIFDSSAAATYQALQASVTKRFSRGWQMTAAYTFSHAIDDVSDVFDLAGAFTLPQDDRNLRAERGDANFDLRHRFVWSSLSNIPFISRFNDAGGVKQVLLGGWQMASISTYQTGQPFTVNTSFDINFDGNLTDRLNTTNGLTPVDSRQQRLNLTAAPASLLAPIGRAGAVGRNTFRASGVASTDFALIKNFRVREGQTLIFRAEAFNLWNRTHFAIPVRILEAPSFGKSAATSINPRQIQFALKYVF